jgi:hypothetical protein
MCRNAVQRHPPLGAELFQRKRIKPIALAALVEGGKYLARMDQDVGRGRILQPFLRAPARTGGLVRRLHQAGPKCLASLLFSLKTFGADKAAAIASPSVLETDAVNLAIAIERVVTANRFVDWNFACAHINAVNIVGDGTDDFYVAVLENGIPFFKRRPPRTLHIGMIGRFQR